MIQNNRVSRYVLYAIGEIILVVIGILIALQINNWNEGIKRKNLEGEYYCKLLEDVIQDEIQVNGHILETEKRLQASNNLLYSIQNEKLEFAELMNEFMDALSLITYTLRPNIAAYEDLKSSGNLTILEDNKLKTKIVDYYSLLDGMIDVLDTNADAAVQLYYEKEDYAEFGWHHMAMVEVGIDKSKVNFNELNSDLIPNPKILQRMKSDIIFIIGANARIKFLYQEILPEIKAMKNELQDKCTSSK